MWGGRACDAPGVALRGRSAGGGGLGASPEEDWIILLARLEPLASAWASQLGILGVWGKLARGGLGLEAELKAKLGERVKAMRVTYEMEYL